MLVNLAHLFQILIQVTLPVLKPPSPETKVLDTALMTIYQLIPPRPARLSLEPILYLSEDSFKTTAETQGPLN